MLIKIAQLFLVVGLTLVASVNVNAASSNSALAWHGYILGEDISNLHGGLKTGSIFNGNTEIVAFYDLQTRFDHNALIKFGILGATCTQYQSLYTYAIQSPSSFLAPRGIKISDLSYQYNLSKKNKIIIGVMDMDDNFNITESASNLLNNAFFNTATLYANTQMATFPFPGFGAMASITQNQTTGMLGIYQGNPQHLSTVFYNGYMIIAEVDHAFNLTFSKYANYSIKGGAWLYQLSDPSIVFSTNARGLYLITQANWITEDARALAMFMNIGYSDQDIKYVPYSLSVGLRSDNIFFGNKDSLSFGLGKIWVADLSSEVAYELAYATELYSGLVVTPDAQYIVKPSGFLPNAWIFMIRLSYNF